MNKQKGLAPILIVLLIALGIGGYLIYQKQNTTVVPQQITQPTPILASTSGSTNSAETANPDLIGVNWKIYTSKEGKFSLKYPDGWYFLTAKENYGVDYKGAKVEVLFSNKLDKNRKIPSGVDIDKSTANGLIAIGGCKYASGCDIWITEAKFYDIKSPQWQGGGGPYPTKRQVSLSELGGKKAILIKSQADTDTEVYKGDYSIQYNVFLGDEHLTLTFGYNDQNQDNEEVLKVFDQILSTFKFL